MLCFWPWIRLRSRIFSLSAISNPDLDPVKSVIITPLALTFSLISFPFSSQLSLEKKKELFPLCKFSVGPLVTFLCRNGNLSEFQCFFVGLQMKIWIFNYWVQTYCRFSWLSLILAKGPFRKHFSKWTSRVKLGICSNEFIWCKICRIVTLVGLLTNPY